MESLKNIIVGIAISLVVCITSTIKRMKTKYKLFNKLQCSVQSVINSIASCFVIQSYICSNVDFSILFISISVILFIISNNLKKINKRTMILINIAIFFVSVSIICIMAKYNINNIYTFSIDNLWLICEKTIIKFSILPFIFFILYFINKNKDRDYSMAVVLGIFVMDFYMIIGRHNLLFFNSLNNHYVIISTIMMIATIDFSLRLNLKLKTNESIYKINKWFIK